MDLLASMFSKKRRSPTELVEALSLDLDEVRDTEKHSEEEKKLQKEMNALVSEMKALIYGHPDGKDDHHHGAAGGGAGAGGHGTSPFAGAADDPAVVELATAIVKTDGGGVLEPILQAFDRVDFETRKNFASIFCYLLRHDVAGFLSTHMPRHTESVLAQLMDGYATDATALPCGSMLRECIRSPLLHEQLLTGTDGGLSASFIALLERHVTNLNFEVAADAFETLSALLTTNKALVFRLFNPDAEGGGAPRYRHLVALYSELLLSDNYVLKRQSLKLLSEFLLDRENFRIMMAYISDAENMKLVMRMLRHKQANIRFEAFHVFKVFVANPDKPPAVLEILAANKGKLIRFLQDFEREKDDEQFAEEKAMLIDTLERLPDVEVELTPTLASSASGDGAAPLEGGAAGGGAY